MNGRWVRSYYEWSCPSCGCMLQAKEAPQPDVATCLGCRAKLGAATAQDLIGQLQKEWEDASAEVRRLLREKDELLDELHAAREAVTELRAMVERAHTEPAPSTTEAAE